MKESVIHDWDGVFYESMDAVLKTYSIISGRSVEVMKKTYTPDWKRFIKEANIPTVPDAEWHRIFKEQSLNAKLFPGAEEYIKKIKNDGYKTALVTSGNLLRVTADLKRFNLSNDFDVVITADDVKKLKPDPECLRIAVRNLNSNVSKCVYIGDTDADAFAAKNIGMEFIGVSWGYHPPEVIRKVNGNRVVHNFDELYMTIKSK